MSFDLDRWERWIFEVIRHPGGLEAGVDAAGGGLEERVIASETRTAAERLGVYANMYFWRLSDILYDEHPALAHALGDEWHATMRRYLTDHPSRHYRLAPLGRHLPDWLAASDLESASLLADVARLERAKEAVFDEPPVTALEVAAFEGLAPEQWAEARLVTIPALRLLATDYPVNSYFQAVLDGDEPEQPAARPSWVVIWRGADWTIWRSNLDAPRYTILKTLQEGGTLGDALMACLDLDDVDPEALMSQVGAWFRDWTADGMFAEIRLD